MMEIFFFTHKIEGKEEDGSNIGKLVGNKLLDLAGTTFIKTK